MMPPYFPDCYPMKKRNCPFCDTESFSAIPEGMEWIRIPRRVLAKHGKIVLCAGLGALAEPYVLAFSEEHYTSAAEFSPALNNDLLDALDECLGTGLFRTGSLCVFEHGGGVDATENTSITCLEHCHLHIVDGAHDLQKELALLHPAAENAILDASGSFGMRSGYLFAGTYHGNRRLVGTLVNRPSCGSQFLRRLLAEKVGAQQWNWRLAYNGEAALRLCASWPMRDR